MKVASGDYIAILNSDDYYVDNLVIQSIANYISKLKTDKYAGVYGKLIKITSDNIKIRYRRGFQISFKELLFSRKLTIVGHASLFISRRCIEDIGYYDSEHFSAAADYDYALRCFKKYKFKYINFYMFNFRIHANSITASGVATKEIDFVLKKNGYYTYSSFLRKCSYYSTWVKFILYNFRYLLNK
jgi:GT2 family glycosyltransferase